MKRVKISCRIYPTEDEKKVLGAMGNIFPTVEFKTEREGGEAFGESTDQASLIELRELIKKQKIEETARGYLLGNTKGKRLHISLNKAAAAMGKVNLVDFDMALGAIEVEIEGETPEALEGLIDWLCGGQEDKTEG